MGEKIQLDLLRLQERLRTRLRQVQNARKALTWTLRAARELFAAEAGAIAWLWPGRASADLGFSIPSGSHWDVDLLTRYLVGDRPRIPDHLLLAPVQRRGRNWAVLVLERQQPPFSRGELRSLFSITQMLTEIVRGLDERRVRRVQRKIQQEIADRQEPKDIIYDILHGLRSLTRYDHSASLYTASAAAKPLRLVAEQIAWTKAKSGRIGVKLPISDAVARELEPGKARIYCRKDTAWHPLQGEAEAALPVLLEHSSPAAPPERVMICASITHPAGIPTLLKISAHRQGILGDYEARLVSEFLALISLVVQFSVRTESLQERVLESERKHALANLTRGIAHDVNNALGAMLPLVQQMREEAEEGALEPGKISRDLQSLESSLQTCRRIFGGMLSIAHSARDGLGHGNLRRSIEGALSVLTDGLRRRGIAVAMELPTELPTLRGNQGDLTQLFLNLFSNARDAMSAGGRLKVDVRQADNAVEVTINDTGNGIPEGLLEQVWEPFFTTKEGGNGLGLAICRSIVWDIGGEMKLESAPQRGTRVSLTLPILETDPGVDG